MTGKQPGFYVMVDGVYREPEFRMLHKFGKRNDPAGSGIPEGLLVPTVYKNSVIVVFMGDGTADMSLIVPVANMGPVKSVAAFFYKILTM